MFAIKRQIPHALVATAVLALNLPAAATAAPLDFAFLPPPVEQQNLCGGDGPEELISDAPGPGSDGELTTIERVRFLQRDIRRYQAEDPNRYFDFIVALRKRLSQADARFGGMDETLDLIGLHIDAGRLRELMQAGLVQQLNERRAELNYTQSMKLAQFFLNGIGVQRDEEQALDLIRDAGFGGNADALLFIARRMAEGRPLPGWEAPANLTATMAFGGLLGQMDSQICIRAERIAQEYRKGIIVHRNTDIALAWDRFAADLGSARAAWRVVEHHLAAGVIEQDNDEMLAYLQRAVERGIAIDDSAEGQLQSAGVDLDMLREILAFNQAEDRGRRRPTLTPLLQLDVNIDALENSPSSPYLTYLREVTQIPSAPGAIYTDLAKEIAVRLGRWGGEAQMIAQLEIAVARDDAEGMRLLAERLLRYRDTPAQLDRAVDLLTLAATRHSDADAMDDLDKLFRCQIPTAPHLDQAEPWARAFRATAHETVQVSATNLISLDPYKDPWSLAHLQRQALAGRTTSLANYLELVNIDPIATETRQRIWADRLDNSDKGLEEFAKLEFELATNPAERALALEFFRRVYLNNGVTSALDVAVAMINDNGTDPAVATEVRRLLRQASYRGEGAAIRLLARLGKTPEAETAVFTEFAQIIEERGDFLALMFALPHVAPSQYDDYFDRAVSLMACSTKDTSELGEAHAILDNPDMAYHWRRIGLVLHGGHVLAKLRFTDTQMEVFDTGAAPTPVDVVARDRGDDIAARWRLFDLTARPDLSGFDAQAAAGHFAGLVSQPDNIPRAFERYFAAPPEVRRAIDQSMNFRQLLARATASGEPEALWRHARLLQSEARNVQTMAAATAAVRQAAEAGSVAAMAEFGRAKLYGTGTNREVTEALEWLDKAAAGGNQEAGELARQLRLR
ncbi:hypothetical protein Q4577_08505 [Marinovum sp. 2_MG-2023]|uniref:hypothetical protein n=1 Tax=unclassified Marinovum TaxID=2647166 RepID=UPI0026E3DD83|nr:MULTISPECIES: hypothetical protein [unclassified Marinovum]MDO6730057.1 hypothetical protein [Marinovum sp. 2_MG-2023]MDO6779871.1 hypothetical protein [Marinovum sp. 1_MG-2023]